MRAEQAARPVCTILCGPNGSGQSTLHTELAPPGRFLNADVVAAGLDPLRPETATIQAGRRVLEGLAQAIRHRSETAFGQLPDPLLRLQDSAVTRTRLAEPVALHRCLAAAVEGALGVPPRSLFLGATPASG